MSDYESTLQNLWDIARASAAGARQAAENTATRARIRLQIGQLKEEMEELPTEVGRTVYATHTGSLSDSEALHDMLAEIDRVRQELTTGQRSLAELRGYALCPDCGEVNEPKSNFCQACGGSLWP